MDTILAMQLYIDKVEDLAKVYRGPEEAETEAAAAAAVEEEEGGDKRSD